MAGIRKGVRFVSHWAGRGPVGKNVELTVAKQGARHTRILEGNTQDVLVVGAACSECFSGENLAQILMPGLDYEREAVEKMSKNLAAGPLSIHTSAGVPKALPSLLDELGSHLWGSPEDWFASFQIEGASAVNAGIDLLAQLRHVEEGVSLEDMKVAVSAMSYHGPASSSFGSGKPLGQKNGQVMYPVPCYFEKLSGESLSDFNARKLGEFKEFLSIHGDSITVMLIEPQWGSSLAAQPWDPNILSEYIQMARKYDIKILSDEVMCGLGRHGYPDIFLSKSWNLDVDAVTFGKAIGGGVFPISGVAVRRGGETLREAKRSALQSHTYAASSVRALFTATEVLRAASLYSEEIKWRGELLGSLLQKAADRSGGLLIHHGLGLMRGLAWSRESFALDFEKRKQANIIIRNNFAQKGVCPYFVDLGCMFSPIYDISESDLRESGKRTLDAIEDSLYQLQQLL